MRPPFLKIKDYFEMKTIARLLLVLGFAGAYLLIVSTLLPEEKFLRLESLPSEVFTQQCEPGPFELLCVRVTEDKEMRFSLFLLNSFYYEYEGVTQTSSGIAFIKLRKEVPKSFPESLPQIVFPGWIFGCVLVFLPAIGWQIYQRKRSERQFRDFQDPD